MTNDLLLIRSHINDSLNEAAEWIAAGEADLADESYYQGQRDVLKELLNVVDKVIKKRDLLPHLAMTGPTGVRYESVRGFAKKLAHAINLSFPESREKSVALTKLQECIQMANAAIAINEKPDNHTEKSE